MLSTHTIRAEHHQSPVGARCARRQREVADGHRAAQLACAGRERRGECKMWTQSKRGVGDRAASGTSFLHLSVYFLGNQYKYPPSTRPVICFPPLWSKINHCYNDLLRLPYMIVYLRSKIFSVESADAEKRWSPCARVPKKETDDVGGGTKSKLRVDRGTRKRNALPKPGVGCM